jgi:hypothetical protein
VSLGGERKALLCTSTYKEKSPQNFTFAALTYDAAEKPTAETILETEFFGIGNKRNDYFKYADDELDKMWTLHPEVRALLFRFVRTDNLAKRLYEVS